MYIYGQVHGLCHLLPPLSHDIKWVGFWKEKSPKLHGKEWSHTPILLAWARGCLVFPTYQQISWLWQACMNHGHAHDRVPWRSDGGSMYLVGQPWRDLPQLTPAWLFDMVVVGTQITQLFQAERAICIGKTQWICSMHQQTACELPKPLTEWLHGPLEVTEFAQSSSVLEAQYDFHICKVLSKVWPSALDSYLKEQHTRSNVSCSKVHYSERMSMTDPSIQRCVWMLMMCWETEHSTIGIESYFTLYSIMPLSRTACETWRRSLSLFDRTKLFNVVSWCAMKQRFVTNHMHGMCVKMITRYSSSQSKWQVRIVVITYPFTSALCALVHLHAIIVHAWASV